MKQTQKPVAYVLRLGLILLAITALVAALLGGVNEITKDKIAALNRQKTDAAKAEVLQADSYQELSFTDPSGIVTHVWAAAAQGYVVECVVGGSQGDIDLMVGVKADGTVSGVSIIRMSETSGLGDNAKKDEWRAQFVGLSGTVSVDKEGGEIESLTGATITSSAICRAVSAATACVEQFE